MEIFFWMLLAWFCYVEFKSIIKYHKNKNWNFSKWKMVNNWGEGGNSVRRNVCGLFNK